MKTGTTALQNFLRNNPKALERQGFCYPFMNVGPIRDIENRNGHFLLHWPIDGNDHTQQICWEKLRQTAQRYPNIVLSEELIWHQAKKHENFWPNLLKDLSAIDCRLKVIVYLRRQDELIQSLWKQGVKIGRRLSCSFEDYIRQRKYRYFPLDYYAHLEEIAADIGIENLIVRVYEEGQYEGEDHTIISDLMHVLGLRMTDDLTFEDHVPNPSLDGNFIELKRILNGLPAYKDMPDFMRSALTTVNVFAAQDAPMPRQSLFSYEDQAAFLKQYAESNQKTAIRFLGRDDGILFQKNIAHLPLYQVDSETMGRDLLLFTAQMFCQQQQTIRALNEKLEKLKPDKPRPSCIIRLYRKFKSLKLRSDG